MNASSRTCPIGCAIACAASPDAPERVGRIILAGGEPLVEPFKSQILFPILDLLKAKYGDGGAKIVMQTTGDLVDADTLRELVRRGVWLITCAGFDEFHVGWRRTGASRSWRG